MPLPLGVFHNTHKHTRQPPELTGGRGKTEDETHWLSKFKSSNLWIDRAKSIPWIHCIFGKRNGSLKTASRLSFWTIKGEPFNKIFSYCPHFSASQNASKRMSHFRPLCSFPKAYFYLGLLLQDVDTGILSSRLAPKFSLSPDYACCTLLDRGTWQMTALSARKPLQALAIMWPKGVDDWLENSKPMLRNFKVFWMCTINVFGYLGTF